MTKPTIDNPIYWINNDPNNINWSLFDRDTEQSQKSEKVQNVRSGNRQKMDEYLEKGKWELAIKLATSTDFTTVDKKELSSTIQKLINSSGGWDSEFTRSFGRPLTKAVARNSQSKPWINPSIPEPTPTQTPKTLTIKSRISTIFDIILIQIMLNCVIYIIAIYNQITVEMTFIILIFVVVIFILKRIKS
jgi:ABC-type multidrug transport system fused ATPase/permease subunit